MAKLNKSQAYLTWQAMKQRCYNPKCPFYRNWGGRGIKICDEWLDNPNLFYEWFNSNGWRKGLTIERIDNNGDYSPTNCRFATRAEQNWNRRNVRRITINKTEKPLLEWCRIFGLSYDNMIYRMDKGQTFFQAMKSVRNTYGTLK